MLCTEQAIYSYDDLYTNFTKTFEQIKIQERPIQKVLVLGLGLGSIPFMLEHVFEQRYEFTLVEIDEEIIYLANKYVLSALDSKMDILCTDAWAFLEQDQEQYDLICVDIFQDDEIPEPIMGEQFLQLIAPRLSTEGILLFNQLAFTPKDRETASQYFTSTFQPFFPDASYLDVRSNYMFMNKAWHKSDS